MIYTDVNNLVYKENIKITPENQEDIINLYEDAGWVSYTKDTKSLIDGINNSLYNISCWKKNQLIGFIRVVGDGETIIYIQDIIVLKKYQRGGIGRHLINSIFPRYKDVRQILLTTEDTEKTNSFYKSLGMKNINSLDLAGYIMVK